ncbi:MAG: PLD nuclease N-terminal domain-containing protein [Planctomycetota bacterium]|jgi:predicted acyltransferase
MSKLADVLSGLPTTAIVAIVVAMAVQLALQIVALIDLVRRDRVLFDRKWIWALVIVVGNLLGAVVYLAVGRKPAAVSTDQGVAGVSQDRARRTIDALYGDGDGGGGRDNS